MFKENLKTKQKPTSSIQVVKKTFSLKCHFVAAMGQGESDVTASRNRVPGQETLMGGLPLAANGRMHQERTEIDKQQGLRSPPLPSRHEQQVRALKDTLHPPQG